MKIYNLTIVYDDDTDEIEYIEETINEQDDDLLSRLVKGGFKDSVSMTIIGDDDDIAKA